MESLTESPRSSLMRHEGNAVGGLILYPPPLKENVPVPVSSPPVSSPSDEHFVPPLIRPPIDTDFVRPYITQPER